MLTTMVPMGNPTAGNLLADPTLDRIPEHGTERSARGEYESTSAYLLSSLKMLTGTEIDYRSIKKVIAI